LNITLIERKDFFEYTPSILRALVGVDAKTGRSRVLKDIYARTAAGTKATFLRGDIFNLSPDAVEVRPIVSNDGVATNNGSSSISNDIDDIVKIPYDYCIIATGTAYKSPIRDSSSEEWTRSQRERMVNQWALKLQEADEIVIVGGGIVGVELAADIIYKYPNKTVRLISKSHILLPELPPKCGEYAAKWLQRHGVRLEMGRVLSNEEIATITKGKDGGGGTQKEKGGETVSLLLTCVGGEPSTHIFDDKFQKHQRHGYKTKKGTRQ